VQRSIVDCWFWCCFAILMFEPWVSSLHPWLPVFLWWRWREVEDDDVATRHWLLPSLKHTRWIKSTAQFLKSYHAPQSRTA
jgi:transposase